MKTIFTIGLVSYFAAGLGCSESPTPAASGESHWLDPCDSDDECGALSCLCGVCTQSCEAEPECGALDGVCAPLQCGVMACVAEPDPTPDAGANDAAENIDGAPIDDAGTPPDARAPDMGAQPDAAPDTGIAPDAGEPVEGCEVEVQADDLEPFACAVPPDTEFACGYLARCFCDALLDDPAEIEACASWNLVPRGAITFADYCGDDGLTVSALVEGIAGTGLIPGMNPVATTTPACEQTLAAQRPEAINFGFSVCRDEPETPHTIQSVRLSDSGAEFFIEFSAPGLCPDSFAEVCWSGAFTDANGAKAARLQLRFDAERNGGCEPGGGSVIAAPVWQLADPFAYFFPGDPGPIRLSLRPRYREPGQRCSDWEVAEPCAEEASCRWADGVCEPEPIELDYNLANRP